MPHTQSTQKIAKQILLVSGGKGGVGKTTVAVNLAYSMSRQGMSVGLLDLDITGPNVHLMVGAKELGVQQSSDPYWSIYQSGRGTEPDITPLQRYNVGVMSVGMMVPADGAVVFGGENVRFLVAQLATRVRWGDIDVLIVDCPPGTGGVSQAIVSELRPTAAVLVLTPQDVSAMDAGRAAALYEAAGIPILGLIRNMAELTCPHCGEAITPWYGADVQDSDKSSSNVLGELPFDPLVSKSCDLGVPVVIEQPELKWTAAMNGIAETIRDSLSSI